MLSDRVGASCACACSHCPTTSLLGVDVAGAACVCACAPVWVGVAHAWAGDGALPPRVGKAESNVEACFWPRLPAACAVASRDGVSACRHPLAIAQRRALHQAGRLVLAVSLYSCVVWQSNYKQKREGRANCKLQTAPKGTGWWPLDAISRMHVGMRGTVPTAWQHQRHRHLLPRPARQPANTMRSELPTQQAPTCPCPCPVTTATPLPAPHPLARAGPAGWKACAFFTRTTPLVHREQYSVAPFSGRVQLMQRGFFMRSCSKRSFSPTALVRRSAMLDRYYRNNNRK